MNKQARKINGFRFVTALAAAELELREQELNANGYARLEIVAAINARTGCHSATLTQQIKTFTDAMDFALCFVMRYPHAERLYGMAKQPLGCSDSEVRRKAYIQNKRWARMEAERKEDDETESEEDAYRWAEQEAARYAEKAKTEEFKRKRAEMLEAQKEAHLVHNWAEAHGYKNPWDVLLELSQGTLKLKDGE